MDTVIVVPAGSIAEPTIGVPAVASPLMTSSPVLAALEVMKKPSVLAFIASMFVPMAAWLVMPSRPDSMPTLAVLRAGCVRATATVVWLPAAAWLGAADAMPAPARSDAATPRPIPALARRRRVRDPAEWFVSAVMRCSFDRCHPAPRGRCRLVCDQEGLSAGA